jgi:natural product precursor
MKKLTKLKLNVLSDANLQEREMNRLKGGNTCGCSCYYEGTSKGSSSSDNRDANRDTGSASPVGCNQYQVIDQYTNVYCSSCTA